MAKKKNAKKAKVKARAAPPPPPPKKKEKPSKKNKSGRQGIPVKSYIPIQMKCPYCSRTMTTRVVYIRRRGYFGRCSMDVLSW